MDYLIFGSLIVEVLILSRVDRKVFGTWYTPFNLLAYPYMVVVVSALLFAPALDFVSVYPRSVLIWCTGLLVFWFPGVILGLGLLGSSPLIRPIAASRGLNSDKFASKKLVMAVAWAVMPLMAYGLFKSVRLSGGWAGINGYDFRVEYSRGLSAHAVVLAFPLVILLIGTYRKGQRAQLATIGGLLVFLFASQVKGTLFAPLIGGAVFRAVRGDLKLSWKKAATGLGLTYLLFNAVYVLGLSFADPSVLADSQTYSGLARHYINYLWAGVLSFGEALRFGAGTVGGPWYEIFSPFINLYRVLFTSDPLVPVGSPHELGMNIDLSSDGFQGMNVYTMFGTLYLYLGPFATLLAIAGISFLFYGLLLVCRSSTNVWYLTLYCALVSWLVLGFFEYYFWHLTFPETVFYCLLLAAVERGLGKRKSLAAYDPSRFRRVPKLS